MSLHTGEEEDDGEHIIVDLEYIHAHQVSRQHSKPIMAITPWPPPPPLLYSKNVCIHQVRDLRDLATTQELHSSLVLVITPSVKGTFYKYGCQDECSFVCIFASARELGNCNHQQLKTQPRIIVS